MSGLCKDCKWWDINDESEHNWGGAPHLCLCDKILKVVDVEERREELRQAGSPFAFEDDEAVAYDGSEFLSTFATGPNFGCVHFEKREGSDG